MKKAFKKNFKSIYKLYINSKLICLISKKLLIILTKFKLKKIYINL